MRKILLLIGLMVWVTGFTFAQVCADISGTGDCDGDGISNAIEGINCNNQKVYATSVTRDRSNFNSRCLSDPSNEANAYITSYDGSAYCDQWNGTATTSATWHGLTPGLRTYYTVRLRTGSSHYPKTGHGTFNSPALNRSWHSGGGSSSELSTTEYSFIQSGTTMTISLSFYTSGSGDVAGDLLWRVTNIYQYNPNIVCGGRDSDGDGVPDYIDLDTDNDGILDIVEKNIDTDGDGTPDYRDLDSDNDGLYDVHEVLGLDTNNDGVVDGGVNAQGVPLAANGGSGYPDIDSDSDGRTNRLDLDSDNDGSLDGLEGYADVDGDSTPNFLDLDSDGDGCYDALEGGATTVPTDMVLAGPYGNNGLANSKETNDTYNADINYISMYTAFALSAISNGCDDTDNDGIIDIVDLDDDNDGVPDLAETPLGQDVDTDGDGIPNRIDLDSDNDGCSDALEAGVFPKTNLSNGSDAGNGNLALDDAVFLPAVPVGPNGLADEVETAPESGQVSYTSYYGQYGLSSGLNACIDSDMDGIGDLVDIDDDNDGIPDAVESPNCFYTSEELQMIVNVTSDLEQYSSFVITNSFDGNTSSQAALKPEDWVGKSIYEITMLFPVAIDGIFVDVGSYKFSSNTSSTFRLEGFNGGAWYPLSIPLVHNSAVDFTVNNTLQPGVAFEKYRLVGVVGSAYYPSVREFNMILGDFVASRYNKASCSDDLDGDGVPNHLDLDSDGDGCYDSFEASVTGSTKTGSYTDSLTIPMGQTTGVGSNGLADHVETSADSDEINYISTYFYAQSAALNLCADSDEDGIGDLVDIDDDNDGIPDAVESPNCFYTSEEAGTIVGITSDFSSPDNFNLLHDGASTLIFNFNAGTMNPGDDIFIIEYPTQVELSSVTVSHLISTTTTSRGKLYGSQDGSSWVELTSSDRALNTSPLVFSVNINADRYKYYSIRNTVTGALAVANTIGEITSAVSSSYLASRNTKSTCSDDLDGDGVPNHLDLDSDGDGCNDSYEASVTGSTKTGAYTDSLTIPEGQTTGVGVNGLADHVETSADSDEINYSSTYFYAVSSALNVCADSDEDGVGDLVDIDDDNDGILDAVESPNCFYTESEAGTIIGVTSDFSSPDNFNLLYDGASTQLFNFNVSTMNPGDDIFVIEYPTQVELSSVTVSHRISNTSTARAKLYGSLDGVSWVELTSSDVAINITPTVFTVNSNEDRYKYYGIRNTVTGNIPVSYTIGEITSVVASPFVPSRYTKPICTDDLDGDGIPNHLDLDSDGDGCYDSYEASVTGATKTGAYTDSLTIPEGQTTGVGVNGLADHVETSADSDEINYTSTYYYAISAALNVCADSDEDGIGDLVDIDDDNDGIPDAVESPNCFYTIDELSTIVNVSSELTQYSVYVIENSYDKNSATQAALSPAVWAGKTLFEITLLAPVSISGIMIEVGSWKFSANVTSTFRLEGNSGGGWIPLSNLTAHNSAVNFTMSNTLQPGTAYDKYRIVGVEGSAYYPSVKEFNIIVDGLTLSKYPKPTCSDDIDGDGLPNHLDLDSDGDGCYDSYEASVTGSTNSGAYTDSLTIPMGQTTGVGVNGLADHVETPVDSDEINYTSTYFYANSSGLNLCADNDEDGIGDLVDIDDDNDGVLDADESPNCFYTMAEAGGIVDITSDFSSPDNFNVLYDGATTRVFNFNAGTMNAGDDIFVIEYPTQVELSSITVSHLISSTTTSRGKLYGSIDGVNWVELTSNHLPLNSTPLVFTVNVNANRYKYYSIRNTVTGALAAANTIGEITNVVASPYLASLYTKPSCTDDLDGDGIPNHLDLDSDGDGCYDIYEASVTGATKTGAYSDSLTIPEGQTTGVGVNGLADHVETSADSDEVNYTSTYYYAISASLNVCADTDGDGIGDLVDLDDDNDGILDVDETEICGNSMVDKSNVIVTSGISWSGNLATVVDGVVANVLFSASNGTSIQNKVYLSFDLGADYVLDAIELLSHATGILNIGSTVRIEGSENGSTWTDLSGTLPTGLSDAVLAPSGKAEYFGFASNTTAYRYYRIYGLSGSTIWWYLQEAYFSVVQARCDVDTDGDGIPNRLDLDSDNDGIYDIVEAANADVIALDVDGNGILENGEFTDTDMDGLSDDIENIISGDLTTNAGVTPVETTPGTPDYLNTDSDGDDCVDAIEAYNDVYVDSNGDGSYGGLLDPFNDMDPTNINGVDGLGRVNAATYPGTNASVTDANISACVPDFRPELVLLNSIIIGESGNINFVVNIDELNNYSLDNGVPVQFTITKDTRVQINWNNSFVGAFNGNPFLQVDNTEWTYDGSNPFAHIWTYNVGGAFPANGLKKIGINAVYTVPATGVGTHSLNVIIPFANVGGESNFDNNIASDIINFDNN